MIIDWSVINRQKYEAHLRDGMRRDPLFAQHELRRELRRTERARLRGTLHVEASEPEQVLSLEDAIVASKVAIVAAATGGDDDD